MSTLNPGTFTLTFSNVEAYRKYKKEVTDNGGTIKHDLGEVLLGFIAVVPPTLVTLIQSSSLSDNGITSFDADSVATTQALV